MSQLRRDYSGVGGTPYISQISIEKWLEINGRFKPWPLDFDWSYWYFISHWILTGVVDIWVRFPYIMISYEISILHRGRRVSTTTDVWLWPWVLHDDLTGLVGNIKMHQIQSKSNGAGFEPTRKTLEVQIHIPHEINNSSHFPMMNLFDEFYPNINNSSQNLMGISDANPGFDPKYQQIQSKSNGPARSSVRIPYDVKPA